MIMANSALPDLVSNARSWNNWSHYLFFDSPLLSTGADFENSLFPFRFCSNYTTIMSKTIKVTDNHVMYDRGAWFLRVIISSSRTLSCSPSVTKQKQHFQLCFVGRARHRKNSWRQERHKTQNRPRRRQRRCLLIAYFYFVVTIFSFRSMHNKTIIRFSSCDMQNNQALLACRSPIQTSIIFSWLILTLNKASWRSLNSHSVDFNYMTE